MLTNTDASVPAGAPETALYAEGIVAGTDGPVLVPEGTSCRRIPGTNLLHSDGAWLDGALRPTPGVVASLRRKLQSADLPTGNGRYYDMAETALLDVMALQNPRGAIVAAASPYWRFVWPRDNAFAVVALALTGMHANMWAALRYVYSMQEADGQFEARYLPDGSGRVPDQRGRQHDGLGLTLWATWVVIQLSPQDQVDDQLPRLRSGIIAGIRAAVQVAAEEDGLPRPGQDYWELDHPEASLGLAAPLLAGLLAGADLARRVGEPALSDAAKAGATSLYRTIHPVYGRNGYQRFPSGGGFDASVAYLLPPFISAPNDSTEGSGIIDAWKRSLRALEQPNGGLRPGQEWPDPDTAWTPQTALFALTAASLNQSQTAHFLLDWLDNHRTRMGSLPEKVTAMGEPAAVAPLGMVSGLVLTALAILDGAKIPRLSPPSSGESEPVSNTRPDKEPKQR
ncbi:glycoside hydrolase family 15 protein [Arthrobacter tumbae]|uniref:glycoside hydrolase family 15 protein n=1 Tax=Arthrobacter tumbae TaxID=163874 RepID=UPI001958F892|nr:glycoside hydrolase family 15 protein [Arthrobacter tumbae]MBM7781751.1 GH15 family glucan-1,4-alpha-glucosidase [Arthrobacter tumbae]